VTVPVTVQREGNLLGLFFTDHPVRSYADARAADHARYAAFFWGMLERGYWLAPSGYEAIFLSTAHTPEDVDATIAAAADVAATLDG
jgi:glutamate-1-semialdehyde 2,1-aminomutase